MERDTLSSPSLYSEYADTISPAEAELSVYLLGPPRVESYSHLVHIPRCQVRALLLRLAAGFQPVPRETLCFLFWPDAPEEVARANLSRLITLLRHALPSPDMVISSEDQVGLERSRVCSDTLLFRKLWAEWKAGNRIECLQDSVALYHAPFLEGFSLSGSAEYEGWITLEREYWNQMVLTGLATIIADRMARTEYLSAIDSARRYLAIDDLNEEMHRLLMKLYFLVGDRGAALRQYGWCAGALQREFGVDPAPTTQILHWEMQRGHEWKPSHPTPNPVSQILPSFRAPMVGCEAAFSHLRQAMTNARTQGLRVVLVMGEAGTGKSRLLREFAVTVGNEALTLLGSCYPETQASHLQPIFEVLRPYLVTRPSASGLYPDWLTITYDLLPELRTPYYHLDNSPTPQAFYLGARVFETLAALMMEVAADRQTVVLLLDDLHWADTMTLDWLAYLVHHFGDRPIVIVATIRSEETEKIAALMATMTCEATCSLWMLETLDAQSIGRLLCHFDPGGSYDPLLADWLSQVTGGNPLFVLETIQTLRVTSGRLQRPSAGLDNLPLSDSLRATVGARVQRLSEGARQVLAAVAMLGQTFGFDTARVVAGRSEQETLRSLEELTAHHLLVEMEGSYRFRHPLVREIVHRGIGYHRQVLYGHAVGMSQKTS